MEKIVNYCEIRRDGKVIDEKVTLDKMITEHWAPEIIVCIRWRVGDRLIELNDQFGMLSYLLPDKSAVAVMKDKNGNQQLSDIVVYNPDGTKRLFVSNTQSINGRYVEGHFMWFEKPRCESPTAVGIVFEDRRGEMYQLDYETKDGSLLGVFPVM